MANQKAKMKVPGGHIQVARVLHEDDELMTLEVFKDSEREITLDPDSADRFLTFIFVRANSGTSATPESWVPWEEKKG